MSPRGVGGEGRTTVPNHSYRIVVRLPEALRARVVEASTRYRRSMNAEIVARLEHSLSGLPGADREAALAPGFIAQYERTFRRDLSAEEAALLGLFRGLSADQRAALVTLLKG